MADWFRYNVNLQKDSDMLHLLQTDGGFTFWWEGLICLAKAVADEDPDRWHGHLVTAAGVPLTEEDFVRTLPYYKRKHRQLVGQFIQTCLDRGMLVREPITNHTRTNHEASTNQPRTNHEADTNRARTEHEPHANVLRINNFSRWWRAPEKRSKSSSGEGFPKVPEAPKTPPAKTDFPQAAALQTDKQTDGQTDPPNPQGGPAAGAGGASSMLNNYRSLDPDTFGDVIDDMPEDTSKDNLLASTDETKLSSLLTVKQQKVLRGRADQLLQNLSPGGLARGQQEALWRYLETLPPPGWKDPPTTWAEHLCHWIKSAVHEVQTALAERKDHGIGNPAAVAIGRAKALGAEKIAEARAKVGKRG